MQLFISFERNSDQIHPKSPWTWRKLCFVQTISYSFVYNLLLQSNFFRNYQRYWCWKEQKDITSAGVFVGQLYDFGLRDCERSVKVVKQIEEEHLGKRDDARARTKGILWEWVNLRTMEGNQIFV